MSDQPKEPELDKKGRVIAIATRPKRGSRPSGEGGSASEKLSKCDIDKLISGAMQKDKTLAAGLPDFPRHFAVVWRQPGVRVPVEISPDGVVTTVSESEITAAVLQYVHYSLMADTRFNLRQKDCEGVMRYWRDVVDLLADEPTPVRWKDEPGLCYRRLPWPYTPDVLDEAMPTWNELLSRTKNSSALIEWLGSLFVADSNMSQYLYLYGQGGDGKSSLLECLRRAFGPSYQATEPPTRSDRHWAASLINARVVAFPDCGDPRFVASGRFKQMDGGVKIDQKYEKAYTEKLKAKFIFASNYRPELSSSRADLRRPVYCEFPPRKGPDDPRFQEKLWQEAGPFFSRCVRAYLDAYPDRGAIRTNNAELEDYIETVVESDYGSLVDEWLHIDPEATVICTSFNAWKRDLFKDRKDQLDFVRYLETRYGLVFDGDHRKSVRIPGEYGVTKAFVGLAFKKKPALL